MKRLIFHIGQPKTGTTTLQGSLAASRKALLKHGVLYPRRILGVNHRHTKAYFAGPQSASRLDRRRLNDDGPAIMEEADRAWKRICEDITHHAPATTILSSEGFFNIARYDAFPDFIRQLRKLADEVVFVTYIRSPSSYYLSSYQQHLKTTGIPQPPRQTELYRRALEPFVQSDQIRLEVHEFSRPDLIGGDIVADFTARYLTPEAAATVKTPDTKANTSISAEAMAILENVHNGANPLEYQDDGPVLANFTRRLIALDSELQGSAAPVYLPGVARIVHQSCTDLDWVRETFGIAFKMPEDAPNARGIKRENLSSVRALCPVDEARYRALWERVIESSAAEKTDGRPNTQTGKSATRQGWLASTRKLSATVRFRFCSVIRSIQQHAIARGIRALVRRKDR